MLATKWVTARLVEVALNTGEDGLFLTKQGFFTPLNHVPFSPLLFFPLKTVSPLAATRAVRNSAWAVSQWMCNRTRWLKVGLNNSHLPPLLYNFVYVCVDVFFVYFTSHTSWR